MTAVVALACADGSVVLGGDSYCGEDRYTDLCAAPKVWLAGRVGGAICGDVRTEATFGETVRRFARGTVSERTILGALPDRLAAAMKRRGLLGEKGELPDSSCFLLAHDGAIYIVDERLGVWRTARHYAGAGAGYPVACAAIAMACAKPPADASAGVTVVTRALTIAAEIHPKVRGPIRTVVVCAEAA